MPAAQALPSVPAARFDCRTRVLAVVFLPKKSLLDVGDGAHRRLLLVDPSSYISRKSCRSAQDRPARWGGGPGRVTLSRARLGCVFPRRIELEVLPLLNRFGLRIGTQVLAAPPASNRALLYATLTRRRSRLLFDTRYCRTL